MSASASTNSLPEPRIFVVGVSEMKAHWHNAVMRIRTSVIVLRL
jgi:hypothetical protein